LSLARAHAPRSRLAGNAGDLTQNERTPGLRAIQVDFLKEALMMPMKDSGIINKPSHHSVDETVEKLKSILRAKRIKLFTLIDHSGEAEKVGLKMRPTKVLIFGNPQAGTPLMLAAPRSAIDLPLKILIWQDDQEEVWISYNSPAYLQERHGFPAELLKNIAVIDALAIQVGQ
jgi:uncharacterized protein (DUF302 family)